MRVCVTPPQTAAHQQRASAGEIASAPTVTESVSLRVVRDEQLLSNIASVSDTPQHTREHTAMTKRIDSSPEHDHCAVQRVGAANPISDSRARHHSHNAPASLVTTAVTTTATSTTTSLPALSHSLQQPFLFSLHAFNRCVAHVSLSISLTASP